MWWLVWVLLLGMVGAEQSVVSLRVGYNVTNFSGKTCPNCLVYFIENGTTYATSLSDSEGNFLKTIEFLPNGSRNISVFSVDSSSRRGAALGVVFSMADDNEVSISNLYLPPTVTYPAEARSGRPYHIDGSAIPSSWVVIDYIGTNKTIRSLAGSDGTWTSDIDTGGMELGDYSFRLRLESETISTSWGPRYDFKVVVDPFPPTPTPTLTPTPTPTPLPTPIPSPTLAPEYIEIFRNLDRVPELLRYVNKDGLLSATNTSEVVKTWYLAWNLVQATSTQGQVPSVRNLEICDLNFDQKCDIKDFSILMYYSR